MSELGSREIFSADNADSHRYRISTYSKADSANNAAVPVWWRGVDTETRSSVSANITSQTENILYFETKFTFLKQWKQRKTHFGGFGGKPGNQERAESHVAATNKSASPGPGAGDLTPCGGCGEAEAMSRSSPASLGRRDTGTVMIFVVTSCAGVMIQ